MGVGLGWGSGRGVGWGWLLGGVLLVVRWLVRVWRLFVWSWPSVRGGGGGYLQGGLYVGGCCWGCDVGWLLECGGVG